MAAVKGKSSFHKECQHFLSYGYFCWKYVNLIILIYWFCLIVTKGQSCRILHLVVDIPWSFSIISTTPKKEKKKLIKGCGLGYECLKNERRWQHTPFVKHNWSFKRWQWILFYTGKILRCPEYMQSIYLCFSISRYFQTLFELRHVIRLWLCFTSIIVVFLNNSGFGLTNRHMKFSAICWEDGALLKM